MNNNRPQKKGQALLIIIMLLATALTVALTATYQSVTETQLTKLEEENQKALAAAEAGIEKLLQSKEQGIYSFNDLGLVFSGIESGQAAIQNSPSTFFITPLLQKDEQYMFYLAPYSPKTKSFTGNSTQQDIVLCFGSSSFNPALEITLLKTDGSIKRYAINPQSQTIIQNSTSASSATSCPTNNPPFTNQYSILSSDISTNSQILIVRVISIQTGATKIGFKSLSSSLPLQGTTITSSARSTAGVEKKVQLFQSYPQIPSEFFVTSF